MENKTEDRPATAAVDRVVASLRERGSSLSAIAVAMGVSRTTVSEVINHRRPGRLTRGTLMRHLNESELRILGWWEEYQSQLAEEAKSRGESHAA